MADTTPTGAEAIPEGTQPGATPNAGTSGQAEIDRIVKERLGRERAKWEKSLEVERQRAVDQWREEQGLDDDALATIAKRDETTAEQRKLKADATKARNELERVQKEAARYRQRLEEQTVRGEVIRAAAGKSHDPEVVWSLLAPSLRLDDDLQPVVLDEKGQPTSRTIEQAVDDLLARKKYLVPPQGRFAGAGSRVGEPSGGTGEATSDFRTAEGRRNHLRKAFGD